MEAQPKARVKSTRVFEVITHRVHELIPGVAPAFVLYMTQRLNNNLRRVEFTILNVELSWEDDFPAGDAQYLLRTVLVSGKTVYMRLTVQPRKLKRKPESSATAPV